MGLIKMRLQKKSRWGARLYAAVYLLNTKCVLISLQFLSETFLILIKK
jgi:hypothetical protein